MKWLAFTYVPMREPWCRWDPATGCQRRNVPAFIDGPLAPALEWICAPLSENGAVVSELVEPWLRASSVPELQVMCAMRGIDWDSDVRARPGAWWDPDAEGPRLSGPERGPR